MPENKNKVIRFILCIVVMVVSLLGIFDIVDSKYTIPISSTVLIGVSIWNGFSYLKEERKKAAVGTFIIASVLLAMLVGYLISMFK